MIKYYSREKLEEFANDLNCRYNPGRFFRPIVIDPYDIIDLVGARLSLQYISPDNSYMGATVFEDAELPMWPKKPYYKGLLPEYKIFHKNTIIIDRDLAESILEQDIHKFNFTVAHECFHLCKHRYYFENTAHFSTCGFRKYGDDDELTELDKIEAQANYAAAAFLMPRKAVVRLARKMLDYNGERIPFGYHVKDVIKDMGREFGVNYTPMVYRLQALGILEEFFDVTI